jgi:Concanavalin A-like lectin/glucanases superfamily/Carbohydrate esterase, sialic acid-specific acetylesterase
MKDFFTLLFCLAGNLMVQAQINFTQIPSDNALYPRDLTTNKATVTIRGTIPASTADSLWFRVTRSDGWEQNFMQEPGDFTAGTFEQNIDIESLLETYTFEVYLKNSDGNQLLSRVLNVVAGDVFMVQGQSNAQAVAYNGDANGWQNNFVRCLGDSNPSNYLDSTWYIAEGNGYFTPGAVGQWALRMGSLIQQNLKIPVAIVNGADPGRPIEYFQRNDADPLDPATNYGRLLQRLSSQNLARHVRAIFYYQGESDGERAGLHQMLFEALYADWVADFPAVEAFYVVQVREGCGAPSLQLRDYQKAFASYLPKLTTLTANGITHHDGCHYAVQGYEQLGLKLYKHVAEDLYNTPSGQQLNVQILAASFLNETNTRIQITTDANVLIAQPGSHTDFILHDSPGTVTGISTAGSSIILELDQPVYQPQAGISYAGHAGDAGGWVLNEDGYGLYTTYNLPIDNHTPLPNFDVPGIMSGAGNCLALDGVDDYVNLGTVLGASYTKEAWIYWHGGGNGNNILSGAQNTAFWAPFLGTGYHLAGGHNGMWGYVIDPTPLVPFQWTHVALTYNHELGEMNLYKNGNLVSAATEVPAHNDPQLFAGAYAGFYTFRGKIDEVHVWSVAQSQEAIRDNMCHKLSGQEAGLTACWRLDETAGTVAPALAGASNGQLANFQQAAWHRSGAPLGTQSVHTYHAEPRLSIPLATGDSVVLHNFYAPEFVHLYAATEVPNVLQPSTGHVLVDNSRFFGVFYPKNSIDTFTLDYHYKGNILANVDEPRLSMLHRANNAQPYWIYSENVQLDVNANTIEFGGNSSGEQVLAIRENLLANADLTVTPAWLSPNPTTGMLAVQVPLLRDIAVFDASGRLCFATDAREWLDLHALPAGCYWIQATTTQGNRYRQTIVLLP